MVDDIDRLSLRAGHDAAVTLRRVLVELTVTEQRYGAIASSCPQPDPVRSQLAVVAVAALDRLERGSGRR